VRLTLLPAFIAFTVLAAQSQPPAKSTSNQNRESMLPIVQEIKRADYEGDRAALKRLHGELTAPAGDKVLASRALYWRGFALWRRAINGFNETPTPTDLADDLNGAVADFQDSLSAGSRLCRIEDRRSVLARLPFLPEHEGSGAFRGVHQAIQSAAERCHGRGSR